MTLVIPDHVHQGGRRDLHRSPLVDSTLPSWEHLHCSVTHRVPPILDPDPRSPYTQRLDHVQSRRRRLLPLFTTSHGPPADLRKPASSPLLHQIMPGRNHAAQSYKPGRPIIDETNYADAPVYAINPVVPRASSHRGGGQEHPQNGNNPRPHAARKASEAGNLNHLLNFSMPRREGRDVPGSGHVPRRSKGVRNAAYIKERGCGRGPLRGAPLMFGSR